MLQDRILLQQETRVRDAGAAFSSTASYAYDRIGQVKAFTWNGQETQFPTDSSGNPVQSSNPSQQWGNRAKEGGDSNALSYDNEGNVTVLSRTVPTQHGEKTSEWHLDYDQANRLVGARHGSGKGEDWKPAVRTSYVYDAEGRLVEQWDFSKDSDVTPSTVERYGQDGANVWADLDSQAKLKRRYFRGDGIDQLLGQQDAQKTGRPTWWYLTDRQGSVLQLVTEQGSAVRALRYLNGQVVLLCPVPDRPQVLVV